MRFLIAFLFCIVSQSYGQVNFALTVADRLPTNNIFYTGKIEGNIESKLIGFLISESSKKVRYEFPSSSFVDIKGFYNRHENNKTSNKILIEITKLDLKEKVVSSSEIHGDIHLEMNAFVLFDGEKTAICTSRSGSSYDRGRTLQLKAYIDKQMQIALENGYIFIFEYLKKNQGVFDAFALDSKVTILPFYTKNVADTVHYQTGPIKWSYFKGSKRQKSDYGAAIFSSFGYESKLYTEHGVIQMQIRPKIFMDKNMSWVRDDNLTTYALAHEQLHFDITYLMSLEYLAKIKTFKAKSEKDLQSMVSFEYLEYYKKLHNLQEQYDTETNHSLNTQQQKYWSDKIKKSLEEMNLKNIFE